MKKTPEDCLWCKFGGPDPDGWALCFIPPNDLWTGTPGKPVPPGKPMPPGSVCEDFQPVERNPWEFTRKFWRDGSPLDGLKDLMWMHLIERGQKPNLRAFKGYCYDIIQAMGQMTGGEHSSSKADYIGFADLTMLNFSVICEATALVRSGALDALENGNLAIEPEEVLPDDGRFWMHDAYPWKMMNKNHKGDEVCDDWSFLKPGGQQADIPALKACVDELVGLTWGRREPLLQEITRLDELAGMIVMESLCLVLSGELEKLEGKA